MSMTMQDNSTQAKIKIVPEPGVRTLLERYVAERNAVIAPAKLTITGIVNEAIREYIDRRTDNNQEES